MNDEAIVLTELQKKLLVMSLEKRLVCVLYSLLTLWISVKTLLVVGLMYNSTRVFCFSCSCIFFSQENVLFYFFDYMLAQISILF